MTEINDIHYPYMTRFCLLIIAMILLGACENKKAPEQHVNQSITVTEKKSNLDSVAYLMNTDTLQFIHFEDNFDYWYCLFLNHKKDTITLITDSIIADEFKNRLFEVKWFLDTLYEAGDNDSKYTAKRMSQFRLVNGKPFAAPITEEQILHDIRNIPEVQSGADQVGIAERPSEGKDYYLIETGTHGTDNFSRFLMFRVYIYPKYQIRVYDPLQDIDLSLDDWRKQSQK